MGLNSASGNYPATDATFTDVGNGWVRCSFKFVSNVTTSSFTFRVRPDRATGYLSTLFYGPQLEATFGTQPTDYNATTSLNYYAPRLDYTKDGAFRGILTEKQKTNLDTESFSLSSQSGFNNHYITSGPSSVLDPTGNTRAYSINATEDNNYHYHRRSYAVTDNTTYVYSVFAKADGYNILGINAASGTDANTGPQFDLTTGTKVYDNGSHFTSVEEYSNGWYRISIKFFTNNPDGSTKLHLDHNIKEVANGVGFSGNGGGILLFGSQLEQFANNSTSFIPTWGTNADATRKVDQFKVDDVDDF